MVAMTHSRLTSSLGLQFKASLYASIDEGGSGMQPGVDSALARLDTRPWLEAAGLTQLPREIAIQRLGALPAKLSDAPRTNFYTGHAIGRHTPTCGFRLTRFGLDLR
jgi:hypothetical protein